MKKQEGTLHELHDLFGNRSEDQWMPAGDAVRGDHDHVDMFALHRLDDAPGNVIRKFHTGACLYSSGRENLSCLRQMLLSTRLLLLLKLHLGNGIFRREGREERKDVHKEKLGMEVQCEVDRRF